MNKVERLLDSLPIIIFTSVVLGASSLSFYFILRSSWISRIYEVSVYRALGVKKNDIFRSFIVEIFVITSISTLIGYVLATLALTKLQDGLFGDFNFFLVTRNGLKYELETIEYYLVSNFHVEVKSLCYYRYYLHLNFVYVFF